MDANVKNRTDYLKVFLGENSENPPLMRFRVCRVRNLARCLCQVIQTASRFGLGDGEDIVCLQAF
jgi:hypothetical protein